ncbi:MAG: AraC family transcriptional regulator [Burkholderiales bacterium]
MSSILRSIHLSGGVYFRCEFSAPWGLEVPENPDAEFHVVVRGQCWLARPLERTPLPLVAGDIAVFLDGSRHRLLDTPSGKALAPEQVIGDQNLSDFGPVTYGGGGNPVTILCGYFRFDRESAHPLLAALPNFIHIRGTESGGADAIIKLMHQETAHAAPGKEAVVDRLSELLFIQILRAHIQNSTDTAGMLAALRDRKVCAALNCMHQSPHLSWTLESLASELGMSRSAFASRFKLMVGQTPIQYLTTRRVQEGKRLLRESRLSVTAIAERVGYGSEAAFGKVFKRYAGVGPGIFRRQGGKATA